jgi:cell wall-associated NlpC family hydrolase
MSRATLRARMGVTAASLIAGLSIAAAAPAMAASPTPRTTTVTSPHSAFRGVGAARAHRSRAARRRAHRVALVHHHNLEVRKVIHEARRQKGKPYVYGADGPGSFDCSGLVRFVFEHAVHRDLPHNAAEQYHSLHHIHRSHLRPGDLIFTDDGSITHVGIFAGHHHWWVAPHTGTRVQLQRIYSAHFVYARVLLYHHRR